jgi:hypothetical protein
MLQQNHAVCTYSKSCQGFFFFCTEDQNYLKNYSDYNTPKLSLANSYPINSAALAGNALSTATLKPAKKPGKPFDAYIARAVARIVSGLSLVWITDLTVSCAIVVIQAIWPATLKT